jgi:hypothetical protein
MGVCTKALCMFDSNAMHSVWLVKINSEGLKISTAINVFDSMLLN